MREPLDIATALSPDRSAVVEACAGSGKTWLLVSRMIRLLLAGAAPSELLAITFTRKAAQEMTDRLHAWLQTLALASDDEVREFLRQRQVAETEIDSLLPRARSLLEAVLTAQPGPTVTTFHGWFLDLLKRAPLEAGLPWGAPLLDRESLLQHEVWEALAAKWASEAGTPHAVALHALLREPGQHNLETLLFNFLQKRAEWWAFTRDQPDPVGYALTSLRAAMAHDPEIDPVAGFWLDNQKVARLRRVGHALEMGSRTERERAAEILQCLTLEPEAAYAVLLKHLLTAGARRKKQATRELEKNLGAKLDAYLRDLDALETALEDVADHLAEVRSWHLNRHGLLLGHALLEAYQSAKAQQGVLDFTDAEWLGCKLLQDDVLAPALNLKLDARYRHLLLDEFQDTNPLQWHALSTWLAESRAADAEMTVFMVGDPKQAIYRFRRGEARVFEAASGFLQQQFEAVRMTNNMTRRLAPSLVTAVNPVFAGEGGFDTHHPAPENSGRAGAVRCVVVETERAEVDSEAGLRNPLTTPLAEAEDRAVHLEAEQFARVLKEEVLGRWAIAGKEGSHAARPGDVMALVRRRTHLQVYERALEAVGIPFITSRRGGLLHALEAQDVIALLETLGMPHADLKLAQVLKSPIFGCSDDELLAVFGANPARAQPAPAPHGATASHGWDRLVELSAAPDCPAPLLRAAQLLASWRSLGGRLPAHDLLDRIFFEGDVEARYAAAVPPALRPQVAANLRAFMQLALTQDAGRYPTLAGFIRELKNRVDDADAAPDEGIAAAGENAVRLLTIHGAKGLEAPVVWVLGGSDHVRGDSYAVLAPWPPESAVPLHFSLFGRKEDRGSFRAGWFDGEEQLAARESVNLLYVALTRAEQALIVSGDGRKNAWLSRLAEAWRESSHPADLPLAGAAESPPAPVPPPPIHAPAIGLRALPAPRTEAGAAGEFFHACLEHHAPPGVPRDLAAVAARLGLREETRAAIEAEARALVATAGLRRFFDPAHYLRARNELELLDDRGQLQRLDRVVEFVDEVWILDYKTGALDARLKPEELLARHRPQLVRYADAVAQLWPHKEVRTALLLGDGRLLSL